MSEQDTFWLVGPRDTPPRLRQKRAWYQGLPIGSCVVLALILLGCACCSCFLTRDPSYMALSDCNTPPCREYLFGTDAMGRDIFTMIWYGGRVSLCIGLLSTLISTVLAVLLGSLSGCAPRRLDAALMRLTEILLSVPSLLLTVLLQAILGEANVLSISLVIGLTGWTSIAKVVRTEVRQLRASEYVLAARAMGGGFFHILRQHLAPNFASSISFMVVMNIRSAILAESTLSFMGIGLPMEIVSWGSMLSLADQSILSGCWWSILIPGSFLVASLLCITELANALRSRDGGRQSNL